MTELTEHQKFIIQVREHLADIKSNKNRHELHTALTNSNGVIFNHKIDEEGYHTGNLFMYDPNEELDGDEVKIKPFMQLGGVIATTSHKMYCVHSGQSFY